jgi:hypothetical protein
MLFIGRFNSLVAVGCAWALGGCLGDSEPNKVDSESHFLTICSGDSDCEASSCICGFCTTTCESGGPDECGLCLESDTFGTACEAERPGVTLCGAGCTEDSECGEGALVSNRPDPARSWQKFSASLGHERWHHHRLT